MFSFHRLICSNWNGITKLSVKENLSSRVTVNPHWQSMKQELFFKRLKLSGMSNLRWFFILLKSACHSEFLHLVFSLHREHQSYKTWPKYWVSKRKAKKEMEHNRIALKWKKHWQWFLFLTEAHMQVVFRHFSVHKNLTEDGLFSALQIHQYLFHLIEYTWAKFLAR